MHLSRFLRASALACALGLAISVEGAPDDQAMAPASRDAQGLYWQGHEALKQGQHAQALQHFRQLEMRLRRDEPGAVDAALYWQAYALQQAGRRGEARAGVQRLLREFPDSRWLDEARALIAEAEAGQDDLVEAALDGLMHAPSERAIPLLEKVLTGNYPERSQRRALFVLSQLDDPRASARLVELARSGSAPLKREAIRLLAMGGDAQALALLREVYRNSAEIEERRAVLHAWMVTQDRASMLEAARDSRSKELQEQALHFLGAMGARAELEQFLGSDIASPELKGAALRALGIAGAHEELARFALKPGPVEPRMEALRGLGIAGAGATLADLYPRLESQELKQAAREGLMISGDSGRLRELYAQASDPDEKRELLRVLSMAGGDAALEAIEQAIEEGRQP
jgi:tetratricopeptide (TPR) repeat protein